MKNKNKSSSFCNNRCWQSNKCFCNFCKHFGHNIETCYQCNKSVVSTFATVTNTKTVQPMALVFAQSQSFGSTFTISRDDFINIIANVIRMVDNASYFSSLSALSGMSPTSWLIDSACCNHWHLTYPYFLNLILHHTLLLFVQQMVPQCLVII